MDYGKNLTWFLSELANAELEQIEHGSIEIYGENEQGQEGSTEIEITELVQAAVNRIESLEAERAHLINLAATGLGYSVLLNNQIVANQAAVIDAFLDGAKPNKGMVWIKNGLFGPGNLPPALKYAETPGASAQKWFDDNEIMLRGHKEYVKDIESQLIEKFKSAACINNELTKS